MYPGSGHAALSPIKGYHTDITLSNLGDLEPMAL